MTNIKSVKKHYPAVKLLKENGSASPEQLENAVGGHPSAANCIFRMRKEGYKVTSERIGRKIVKYILVPSPEISISEDSVVPMVHSAPRKVVKTKKKVKKASAPKIKGGVKKKKPKVAPVAPEVTVQVPRSVDVPIEASIKVPVSASPVSASFVDPAFDEVDSMPDFLLR